MLADVVAVALEHRVAVIDALSLPRKLAAAALERQGGEVVAAHTVEDGHVKGRGRGALLAEPADMKAPGVTPAMEQLVQGPGVAVEGDHDLVVGAKDVLEAGLRQTVRMHV